MPIETNASIESFFLQTVESACKNQRVEASPAVTTYVAGLLSDFVRPDSHGALSETLDRSLTLMLDEALKTPPQERFEKLRTLGDGTLYVSGFFGDHLEARGVDDGFVASIGGFAYRSAGSMLRGGASAVGDLYAELAAKFQTFVSVLAEVAETTSFGAKTNTGALRLYEKWLRTGSERLARELAAQGLTPTVRLGTA